MVRPRFLVDIGQTTLKCDVNRNIFCFANRARGPPLGLLEHRAHAVFVVALAEVFEVIARAGLMEGVVHVLKVLKRRLADSESAHLDVGMAPADQHIEKLLVALPDCPAFTGQWRRDLVAAQNQRNKAVLIRSVTRPADGVGLGFFLAIIDGPGAERGTGRGEKSIYRQAAQEHDARSSKTT